MLGQLNKPRRFLCGYLYLHAYLYLETKRKDRLQEENEMEKQFSGLWGKAVRDGARGWLNT